MPRRMKAGFNRGGHATGAPAVLSDPMTRVRAARVFFFVHPSSRVLLLIVPIRVSGLGAQPRSKTGSCTLPAFEGFWSCAQPAVIAAAAVSERLAPTRGTNTRSSTTAFCH